MTISRLTKTLFGIRVDDRVENHENSEHSLLESPSWNSHAPTAKQLTQKHQTSNEEFSPTTSKCLLSFVLLPGEVRNLIYTYVIFPYLRTITIYHCAGTVFSLPIFRISRQVRYEALSYFCASKTIYLSGLNVANDFFAIIGEQGVGSLRHVIVRCPNAWLSSSEKTVLKKGVFLAQLKRATSLQRLNLIIGQCPLSKEDLRDLKTSHTSGAKFLIACKNVVDGLDQDENEDETAMKTGFDKPCNESCMEQAGACLRSKNKQHRPTEQGGRDVFRLCQVTGVVGKVTSLELPH